MRQRSSGPVLALYRGAGDPPFTAGDAQKLAAVSEPVVDAIRRTVFNTPAPDVRAARARRARRRRHRPRAERSRLALTARGLTAREQDVAVLVLQGADTRAIAASLHLSPHTVQDHLKAVFATLDVTSRREMVARLILS